MSAAAGSRAMLDDNARHNTACRASGRRPRRPVTSRHTAIATSGDSDENDAAGTGAWADVVEVRRGYVLSTDRIEVRKS